MEALDLLWRQGAGDAFASWVTEQGDLLWSYATYAALAESHQGGPSRWAAPLAERDPTAIERWRRDNDDRVRFHAWVQWLVEEQLREASGHTGLVADLAIGVDPDGADAWLWRDAFATGVTVGAPPDEFNLSGQDWGLPPFDPWRLRAADYEPFIQTIRSAMRHCTGMRIDHVMGLFRLYWIPQGADPDRGTYVRYPYEDLLNIVALESHRNGAYVIGEDLGTVEDLVRDQMSTRRMLSYRLLWFEDDLPRDYPSLALAAVSNHDLPTIAGLWTGKDIEALEEAGVEVNREGTQAQLERLRGWLAVESDAPLESVIEGCHRLLAAAPSAVVLATLEDALGVIERPNIPGTTDERPNWSIPLPVTLEEIPEHPLVQRVIAALSVRAEDAPPREANDEPRLPHL